MVLILVACAHAADPDLVLHKRVSEVRLTLVATDNNGRPWEGLSPSSLAVADQGSAVSDFQLRSANDLPLQVGIVLDLSDSTRKSWPAVRALLIDSMQGLLRPGDQILMITFNTRIETERVLARPEELGETFSSSGGGLTALYDALYRICQHPLFSRDLEPRRSAIILFSDGEDNLSYRDLGETIASAQRGGIAIYTITAHKPNQWRRGDGVLQKIAGATGGRAFVINDFDDLQAALQSIQTELRNSYLLFYRPPREETAGQFHEVEVLPARNVGLHLRTRAGYFTTP